MNRFRLLSVAIVAGLLAVGGFAAPASAATGPGGSVVIQKIGGTNASKTIDYYNTAYKSTNAALPCTVGGGSFQTQVTALVHFPANYVPYEEVAHVNSPVVSLSCGVSLSTPTGAAVTTFTVTAPR